MSASKRTLNRICLVNMPFFRVGQSSFVLTQIKGVLEKRFGGAPCVEIQYMNHDFARYLGVRLSERISFSNEIVATGIGEWFFRTVAFPGTLDVSRAYFNRYFPGRDFKQLRELLLKKRVRLDTFFDELIDSYHPHEADIVGLSSMVAQNLASFTLARKIKERNRDCIVVMGGANCVPPIGQRIVREIEAIDFVFSGPSLVSFPRFIEHIMRGETNQCHGMRGILSKDNTAPGGTHHNLDKESANGEELDINERIVLDYDSFFESLDRTLPGEAINPVLMFETSRGCWWGEKSRCSFCGMDSYTLASQVMHPERAIETIREVLRYAPRCKLFMATDIIMPKTYPREVFAKITCPPGSAIMYEVRAAFGEEELTLISNGGVKGVSAGIECISTTSLRLVNKRTSAFRNITFLKRCLLTDVYPAWLFLVGIPGETGETYKKYLDDIPAILHLPPPYYISPVIFERDNAYFNKPEHYDLSLAPYDCYELIYPYDRIAVRDLALLFSNTNTRAEYCQALFEWFFKLKKQINYWIDSWYSPTWTVRPMLHFKKRGGRTTIYDSRSGEAIEHEVTSDQLDMLTLLEQSMRIGELRSRFPDMDDGSFHWNLSRLREKRLIFEEVNRCISLILPRETQPFTFTSGKDTGSSSLKTAWDKEFDTRIFDDAELRR